MSEDLEPCLYEWATPARDAPKVWDHACSQPEGHEGPHRCAVCGAPEVSASQF